jgi:hypothetical protein
MKNCKNLNQKRDIRKSMKKGKKGIGKWKKKKKDIKNFPAFNQKTQSKADKKQC